MSPVAYSKNSAGKLITDLTPHLLYVSSAGIGGIRFDAGHFPELDRERWCRIPQYGSWRRLMHSPSYFSKRLRDSQRQHPSSSSAHHSQSARQLNWMQSATCGAHGSSTSHNAPITMTAILIPRNSQSPLNINASQSTPHNNCTHSSRQHQPPCWPYCPLLAT